VKTLQLDALSRTALIPFWSRADDHAQNDPVLGDAAAAALAPRVAERFGRVEVPAATRIGCCLRNLTMDTWLTDLTRHQAAAAVVDIGVGLDTRMCRLPGIVARYIEVDSEPIIGLRNEWLPNTGAVRLAGDGMRIRDWIADVRDVPPTSVAVVLEGVLAYQRPSAVRDFLHDLASALPGAHVLFDSVSPLSAWAANRPAALASGRPRYAWSCWSTRRLVISPRRWWVVREEGFMDQPRQQRRHLDGREHVLYRLPVLRRSYRLTHARLPLSEPG
jgi:O-methyltransferase involved in polyketide biosynthesis